MPSEEMNKGKTWYVKNMGDAMLAEASLERVREIFAMAFVRENAPDDMAIYFRHESEGRLHCDLLLYFSPSSSAVALAIGASPCARPAMDGLGLLAGKANRP